MKIFTGKVMKIEENGNISVKTHIDEHLITNIILVTKLNDSRKESKIPNIDSDVICIINTDTQDIFCIGSYFNDQNRAPDTDKNNIVISNKNINITISNDNINIIGDIIIDGNLNISGDVNITGNLTVSGNTLTKGTTTTEGGRKV